LVVLSNDLRIVQKLTVPLPLVSRDDNDDNTATAGAARSAEQPEATAADFVAVDTCHADGKIAAIAGAETYIYR
jgi:hypothetical protein